MKKIVNENSRHNIYRVLAMLLCLCLFLTGNIGIINVWSQTYDTVLLWTLYGPGGNVIDTVDVNNQSHDRFDLGTQNFNGDTTTREDLETFAGGFAETLKNEYHIIVKSGYWPVYETEVKFTNVTYEITTRKESDGTLRWLIVFTMDHNHENEFRWPSWSPLDNTFRAQIIGPKKAWDENDPRKTRTGARQWRLYDVNGGMTEVGSWEGNIGVTSTSIADADAFKVQPDEYAQKLFGRYNKIDVFTEYNSNNYQRDWHAYVIRKIAYDETKTQKIINGSDLNVMAFRIYVDDDFEWMDGRIGDDGEKKVSFYIIVYEKAIYENTRQWRLCKADDSYIETSNEGITIAVLPDTEEITDPAARADELKNTYKRVRVRNTGSWDNSVYSNITNIVYDEEKTSEIKAIHNRDAVAYKVTVSDIFHWASDLLGRVDDGDTTVNFYIVIYAPTDFGNINDFLVSPREPDGVIMNLFDYWPVTGDPTAEKGNPWQNPGYLDDYDPELYDTGINGGHALKFFYEGYSSEFEEKPFDRTNDTGLWNHSTVHLRENQKGIVKNKLGSDGFPELNLNSTSDNQWRNYGASEGGWLYSGTGENARKESLKYLFDPKVKHEGKASHANVSGLLQMNQSGYYYYDSKLNFAEYDEVTKQFLLYNTWGVEPGGMSPNGQFFPFNTREQVFSGVNEDSETGKRSLVQFADEEHNSRKYDKLNHFFGFTMEVGFQQPKDGTVDHGPLDPEDMIFKFAGDDDIWIFVDDVLVLDMGGVHSGAYGEINFATGEVFTGLMDHQRTSGAHLSGEKWSPSTLRDMYKAAGMEDATTWRSKGNTNTFADGTIHTIKLFYMERGHWDSNFAMYFNLQPEIPHRIYKVNEDGAPLKNASFDLYEAQTTDSYKESEKYHIASDFEIKDRNNPIASLTTGDDGYALMPLGIDFAKRAGNGQRFYILEETKEPEGYKEMKTPIVMEYDRDLNVFNVLNQYEVGSYASYSAIIEDNMPDLDYALLTVKPNTTDDNTDIDFNIDTTGVHIRPDHQRNAIMFAVPMIYTDMGNGNQWYPIYGSNTEGFHIVDVFKPNEYFDDKYIDPDKKAQPGTDEGTQESYRWALRHNLLAAALRQASYTSSAPDWYFRSEEVSNSSGLKTESSVRFTATLRNLPGDANRYLIHNRADNVDMNNADLRLVGLLVDNEVLDDIFGLKPEDAEKIHALDDETRYRMLKQYLQGPYFNDMSFEENWDSKYDLDTEDTEEKWPIMKDMLKKAYVKNQEDTTREQGVNLAYINPFTRYYGSVIYIPNERRELRLLKQDTSGAPLSGARFGLFDTFTKAAMYDPKNPTLYTPKAIGTTDDNGLLIFNIDGGSKPGSAYVDWNRITGEDDDQIFWIREINPPNYYKTNEAIVQVYAGDVAVFANASAYTPGEKYTDKNGKLQVKPELIDNIVGKVNSGQLNQSGLEKLAELQHGGTYNKDKVTVRATIGQLYQTMKKYADPILNTTLLDIHTYDSLYIASENADEFREPEAGRYGNWHNTGNEGHQRHFWGDKVRATSSDYSLGHQQVDNDSLSVFSTTENGYLFMTPTQTTKEIFEKNHAGERRTLNSRRDSLFLTDGTPVDISGVFAPVNVIVMQDEVDLPGTLSIRKTTTDNLDKEAFKFKVTLTHNDMALLKARHPYPYIALGGVAARDAIKWTVTDESLTGEFELKHGQTIKIYNLPEDTEFTVEETNRGKNYELRRIEASSSGVVVDNENSKANGTIIKDTTVGVEFVNAPISITPETPPSDLPDSGGKHSILFYAFASFLFTLGTLAFVSAKKRKLF